MKIAFATFLGLLAFVAAACVESPEGAGQTPPPQVVTQPVTVTVPGPTQVVTQPVTVTVPGPVQIVTRTVTTTVPLTQTQVVTQPVPITTTIVVTQTVTPTVPGPAAPPPSAPPTQPIVSTACPETGTAQVAIGLSVVRLGTEACAWTWRSVPAFFEANVPQGYIATLHLLDDRVVVTDSPGKQVIKAGTFRFINGYPAGDAVYDRCQLLKKEKAFGQQERPSFTVEPLGFSCP